MDKLRIPDYDELGNLMFTLANENAKVVTAVLTFDDASELLKWLLFFDEVSVGSIDLQNEDYAGYNKEYLVTIDTDLVVDVSPAYNTSESKYFMHDTDIALFGEDVESELLHNINAEIEYGIEFGNYDEDGGCGDCCGDCSNCESREKSQKICDSLELLVYILGHLYDN